MTVKVRDYKSQDKGRWLVDIIIRHRTGGIALRRRLKAPSWCMSKVDAKRWGEDVEAQLRRSGAVRDSGTCPTVSEFLPRYIEGYCRANRHKASSIYATQSIFRKHLLPLVGDRRLDEIRDEDLQRLKGNLADRKPKTVNNIQVQLSRMLRIAERWGIISRAPVRFELLKVDPAVIEFYEPLDYERLVVAAGRHGPNTVAAILLGGDAGLRDGEIRELQAGDIDWSRKRITVRRKVWRKTVEPTKSHRPRTVPMSDRLVDALRAIRHLGDAHVLLFGHKPVNRKRLCRWLGAAQKLAGLPDTENLHTLRHTYGAHLAAAGVPAKTIQAQMGHASIATTDKYIHLLQGAGEDAIRRLQEFRAGVAPAVAPRKNGEG